MEQNTRTKKFVNGVKALIDSGLVKNHTEIINALDWEKTMFSNVLNGRRNVPSDVYKKFSEVYQTEDINVENYQIQQGERIDKMCEVLLSAVGEILAIQRGEPAGKVIEALEKMVNDKLTTGNAKPKQDEDKPE